ncbi:MAG: LexA family transcriptional regulator [Chitinophagaceae bacterium]|nr:LexA family transcriptional regulator [Chitinophagaceae bacterium]MCW5905420.1 LexA family transcriptional regulator [Chitinophagaceae bacterium]
MSYAGKNLRFLRKQRSWTQEEFASKLHIKRSLIGAYEEERAEPKLEVLEAISSMFNFSLDELLLKDLSAEGTDKGNYLEQRRRLKLSNNAAGLIHFVPQKAAAGYLNGYADPNFLDELNTFTLPMLSQGDYRAFEIIGDSMMPTPSGSVIVGEKIERLDDVKSSNTYILLSKNDGIVYKRLIKNTKPKNTLTLMSDNPIYEPYNINSEDVLEVWKAVYILQKANSIQRWEIGQLADIVDNLQQQVTTLNKKLN